MSDLRSQVAATLAEAPIIGVVRTDSASEAAELARRFIAAGLQLIEITFTVPGAPQLVSRLLEQRGDGPPWIGMGTVTNRSRVDRALEAGAEFIVSPNTSGEVAGPAIEADRYLVLGALSCSEIVRAAELGADLVKVYPLPPVGGPSYLAVVRQPLGDIPMLAAGGFDIDQIPDYRAAGATAFGIGARLLGNDSQATRDRLHKALAMARGEST